MVVRRVTVDDVAWVVARLGDRRSQLVSFAPVLWRPAPDAAQRQREFLTRVLAEHGAVAYRTGTGLMIAQSSRRGWLIDDAAVDDDAWVRDGEDLWRAITTEISGHTRFVCPVPETARRRFAKSKGFRTVESWWHWHAPAMESSTTDGEPSVQGASATLVPAPPVYEPGGPILFLSEVQAGAAALPAAKAQAEVIGSPVVVVSQPVHDNALEAALIENGFVQHCYFLETNVV